MNLSLRVLCLCSLLFCKSFVHASEDSRFRIYVDVGRVAIKDKVAVNLGNILPVDKIKLSKSKILKADDFIKIRESYIAALEKFAMTKCGVDAKFVERLKKEKAIRNAFWSAISPDYDNIKNSCIIFDNLLNTYPKRAKKYFHLAIAIAVVWDTPDAVRSSQLYGIWGFSLEQFPPIPDYYYIFDYFTTKSFLKNAVFSPDNLRWPILVQLVTLEISKNEIAWVRKKYLKDRRNLSPRYYEVEYDNRKTYTHISNIGNRQYALINILKYGGICGDRAYFLSQNGEVFGIPSMKVAGRSRYGSMHVWSGFLTVVKKKPRLEFVGGFQGDMYYTGLVFEAQTRTLVLDRYIQQMYSAVSISYSKYIKSLLAYRVGKRIKNENKELSLALAKYAIKINSMARPGWKLLFAHIKSGNVERKEVRVYLNKLIKDLGKFPDIVEEGVEVMMSNIALHNLKKRIRLYDKVMVLFKNRPDLQVKLRIIESKELVTANKDKMAIRIAMKTCLKNVKESFVILPLVKQIVCIAKYKGFEKETKKYFVAVDEKFPKKRGQKMSKAYIEFKDILRGLDF